MAADVGAVHRHLPSRAETMAIQALDHSNTRAVEVARAPSNSPARAVETARALSRSPDRAVEAVTSAEVDRDRSNSPARAAVQSEEVVRDTRAVGNRASIATFSKSS